MKTKSWNFENQNIKNFKKIENFQLVLKKVKSLEYKNKK
jgi:hypothetical protein